MKKIFKTISMHPLFKNKDMKEQCRKYNMGYVILFRDNTYKIVYYKDDLLSLLENDNKQPVRYIFDLTDRIIIDRDISIMEDKE